MRFELIHSEVVYRGRAFSIRRDRVRLPDDRAADLDIVDHVDSVLIIPFDKEGNVHLVRQYRHATGDELLELPAGTLDPGELPLVCARRELREETGLDAEHIEEIGSFYLAPGYSTEFMHVYLAMDLKPGPLKQDEDEFLEVVSRPLSEVLEMARSGRLQDAKTMAALLLLQGSEKASLSTRAE
jgi:ADP-ribose pyrophosphatase